MDNGKDKDLRNMRQPQLALSFDTGIQRDIEAGLEADTRRDTASADDLPMEERHEVGRAAWSVEHMADAICRLLDWQDYMQSLKRERYARAMRTRHANRHKASRAKDHDGGVVAVPQREQFRRFLSDGWRSEH